MKKVTEKTLTEKTLTEKKLTEKTLPEKKITEKTLTEKTLPEKTLTEKVTKIIADHLGVNTEEVTDTANLVDDLGADSLDTVELVMAFEEEFDCEIPDNVAEKILTIKDAIKFIESYKKT